MELILPLIRELRVAYPEIELSVQVDTSDKLADSLLSREIDFYIGRIPEGIDTRALTLEPIGPEPVSLVVRLEHPLIRRPEATIEHCLDFDWVMQPEGSLLRRTVEEYLLRNGYRPPARILSTSSMLLTLAIICETNAIAPIADAAAHFYAAPDAFGGRIRQLPVARDMQVLPFSLVSLREADASPAMVRVLTLLRQKISRR